MDLSGLGSSSAALPGWQIHVYLGWQVACMSQHSIKRWEVEEPIGGQRPSRTATLCPRRNSRRTHEKTASGTLVCMWLLILGPALCGLSNVC